MMTPASITKLQQKQKQVLRSAVATAVGSATIATAYKASISWWPDLSIQRLVSRCIVSFLPHARAKLPRWLAHARWEELG